MRISLLLDLAADTHGDRIAVDGDGGALGFEGLRTAARGFAAHLIARPAQAVGYLGVNGPALPVALFGAAMAGRAFAPLNYRLTDEALRALAARLAPALIVADDDMAPRLAGIAGVELIGAPALLALPPADQAPPDPQDDETAVLLFTSGTTGAPKAALLGHANLTGYVMGTVDFAAAGADEATLVSVPPYHIAGISAILSSVWAGRRIVQLPAFDPAAWVDAAARHRVTHAMVVPTMLARILDVIEAGAALPALRALASGGGRMPRPLIERALHRLPHVAFANAYGLTETSSTISVLGPADHEAARQGDPLALARLDSVGCPVPGVQVEIRDGSGSPCAAGIAGEVWVRGDQVSGRYAGHSATDAEGWFPTRDRGWFDAGGYLYLDGRLDDVIVRGGENISPGEIEDALRSHPAVADAAVIGVPDPQWGERVVAFVVPHPGTAPAPKDLRDHVRRLLRSTRTPEIVHLRPELPYSETGKLLRRVLRDDLAGV